MENKKLDKIIAKGKMDFPSWMKTLNTYMEYLNKGVNQGEDISFLNLGGRRVSDFTQ